MLPRGKAVVSVFLLFLSVFSFSARLCRQVECDNKENDPVEIRATMLKTMAGIHFDGGHYDKKKKKKRRSVKGEKNTAEVI